MLPTYRADSGSMKFKGFYDYLINSQGKNKLLVIF